MCNFKVRVANFYLFFPQNELNLRETLTLCVKAIEISGLVCYHRLDEAIHAIANGTLNQPVTKLDRSSEEPLGLLVNPNLYQSPPQVSGLLL